MKQTAIVINPFRDKETSEIVKADTVVELEQEDFGRLATANCVKEYQGGNKPGGKSSGKAQPKRGGNKPGGKSAEDEPSGEE